MKRLNSIRLRQGRSGGSSSRLVSFAWFRTIVPVLAIAAVSAAAAPPTATVDPHKYLDDIKALTTPAMEGRGDGSKGLTLAEHLIEQRFKEAGLAPAGTDGYAQAFTLTTGAKLKGDNHLAFTSENSKGELKLNQEFVPFSFSASGSVIAPVVFAGYGASADEFNYDDYSNIDVKDKIVVLLRYEPPKFSGNGARSEYTRHAALITKAINARNHGAKAVVLVNGSLPSGEQDLLTRFGSVSGPEDAGILIVQAKNDAVEPWFKAAGKSLSELQKEINTSSKPDSFAFPGNLQISLDVNIERIHATVNNVIGYLPGKTDEYVIVGAHYDHLGRGYYDSLAPSLIGHIHPGADDNASGTAGVMELAAVLAPMKGQLRRGILFETYAGEELGLLGSADWVSHPTMPLDKAVAMLNMDMIGRIRDNKVYIGGVGTGSTFKSVLDEAENGYHFNVDYSIGGYGSSDHTSFVTKRIPVLFFFSGLHEDYHKPSDTWDKINADGAAELLDMISKVTVELASEPERPEFHTVVEERPASEGSNSGSGYGPYFGSVPDFGQVENGVKFSDVLPGSPAAKAGLKAGDVLVQFGNAPIKNLYDFADALRRSKVGEKVDVKVLRDGAPLTVTVTLEQRK